jgi:copper transport protein
MSRKFTAVWGIMLVATVAALLALFQVFPVSLVAAHANLARAEPAPNAVLEETPDRVIIWFTEPIEPPFSRIEVLDSQGRQVDNADSQVDRNDPAVMSVTLPNLERGTYTVAWRNLSTVDGHTIRGNYFFSVGEPISAVPTLPADDIPLVQSPLEPVFRWVMLLGALTLAGGLAFELLVTRPVLSGDQSNQNLRTLARRIASRNDRLLLVGAGVALLGSLGQLVVQAAVVHEVPLHQALGGPLFSLLGGTQWGQVWLWRIGLLALATALLVVSLKLPGEGSASLVRTGRALSLLVAALMLLTVSLVSHGAATTGIRTAAIFSDYVHLLAAAIWVGGIFHLLSTVPLVLVHQPQSQRRAILSGLVPRFSVVAILSVGTLIISGLYSGWAQVTIPEALATPYGATLLVKVGLVAALLLLGALNLFWVRPRLNRQDGAGRQLRLLLSGEAALAVLVILSVGMLTSMEPARQVASRLGLGQEDRLLFRDTVEGADIALRVDPGQVGPNRFTVSLTDRLGRPIINASEVTVSLTYLEADLGATTILASPADPGEFIIDGIMVNLAGDWQAELVVRRPDAFDARTAFRFEVLPSGPGGAPIAPDPEMGRLLWGVELALLGFLFIAVAVPLGGWWTWRGAAVMGSGLAAFAVGWILMFSTQWGDPGAADAVTNPFPPTAESLETGRQVYQEHCLVCHGTGGRGDGPAAAGLDPPPLDLVIHVPLHFDRTNFAFIRDGIPNTAMPPFDNTLTNEEIWHVLNYIKSLE